MRRVLIVTNDFPPRRGGIQSFVHALATRLPADAVVRLRARLGRGGRVRRPAAVPGHPAPHLADAARAHRGPPRGRAILAEYDCDTVLFGAAAPLGLLAPALRRAGARRIVALTHGHEAGWAALPAARVAAAPHRRRGRRRHLPGRVLPDPAGPRAVPGRRLGAHGPAGAGRGHRAPSGPAPGGTAIRQRLGHRPRPPGRGLRLPDGAAQGPGHAAPGLAAVRAEVGGDPLLLLVGDGPYRAELGRLAQRLRRGATRCCSPGRCRARSCRPTTTRRTCSPCRAGPGAAAWTWRASASSTWRRPPPACRWSAATRAARRTPSWTARRATWCPAAARTRSPARLIELLGDPAGAAAMGDKGQAWVDSEWRWELVAERLSQILAAGRSPQDLRSAPAPGSR